MSILISNINNYDINRILKKNNVIVYDKGDINIPDVNIKKCNNNGFHLHTLFEYIIDNYYNLPNQLLFLGIDDRGDFNFENEYIEQIFNLFNKSYYYNFKHFGTYINVVDTTHINETNPISKEICKLTNNTLPNYILILEGIFFCLTKESILIRNIDFYIEIKKLCEIYNNFQYEDNILFILTNYIFTNKFNISLNDTKPNTKKCSINAITKKNEKYNENNKNRDINIIPMNNELELLNVCFKPPSNYCDFCNKININKPDIKINHFCCKKCYNKYININNTTP